MNWFTAASREMPPGADIGTRTRVLGEQIDEENREVGGRNSGQADQLGAATQREGICTPFSIIINIIYVT